MNLNENKDKQANAELESEVIINQSLELKLEMTDQDCDVESDASFSITQELLHEELDIKSEDESICFDGKDNLQTQLPRPIKMFSGALPFKCNFCEYSCGQKENMKNHIRSHTGEKLFQCNFCDYCCNQKVTLEDHLRSHTETIKLNKNDNMKTDIRNNKRCSRTITTVESSVDRENETVYNSNLHTIQIRPVKSTRTQTNHLKKQKRILDKFRNEKPNDSYAAHDSNFEDVSSDKDEEEVNKTININKNDKKKNVIKKSKRCSRTIITAESSIDSKNETVYNSNLHTIQTRSVRSKRTRTNCSQQQRKILDISENEEPDDSYAASDSDDPSVKSYDLEDVSSNEDEEEINTNQHMEAAAKCAIIHKVKNSICNDTNLVHVPEDAKEVGGPENNKCKRNKYSKKKEYCIFCEKLKTNMSRHFELCHPGEEKVIKFLQFKKGSQQRAELISKLRNEGNFKHNLVHPEKLILVRRRYVYGDPENPKKYFLPCTSCKAFFSHRHLPKHYQMCSKVPTQKGATRCVKRDARALTNNIHHFANDTLKYKIMPPMRNDSIFEILKNDRLIILYGNHLTPKYVSHQEYIIRQRLRFLGRYLIMVKQINSDILELEHLFRPCHFETALKAVCQLAEVNNTTSAFIKPKVALDMIHCLKICSKILETTYLKEGNDKQRKNVNSFFKLLQSQSVGRINQSAHRELIASSRQNSIKKLRNLPLSDDITKFKSFLLNRAKTIYQNLLDNPFSYVVWRQLAELTLLYIVVYNGKRSGESQGILVEDFLNIHLLTNCSMPEELESFEGIDKDKITYKIIIRGKLNRTSCALIPENLKLFLDYIYEHRAEAKVPDDNPYLFGLPGKLSGLRHKTLQTCFLMRKYTPMAKLQHPQNVRTTLLRNHLATKVSTLQLEDAEHETVHRNIHKDLMINKFLDQDINVDTTSSTAETININKNDKRKNEIKNNKKCSRTITTAESSVGSKNETVDNGSLHTIQTRSVRSKRTRTNYSQQQRKILDKSENEEADDSYAASDSDDPSVKSYDLEDISSNEDEEEINTNQQMEAAAECATTNKAKNSICIDNDVVRIPNEVEGVEGPENNKCKRNKYSKKKEYCIFCEKLKTNMSRHFELCHPSEEKVIKFLQFKKGSQQRAELISKLRNEGNFKHNLVHPENLILVRRRYVYGDPENPKKYFLPCTSCKAFFSHRHLPKHYQMCSKVPTQKGATRCVKRDARALTNNIHHFANDTLKYKIMPPMRNDSIFEILKNDRLIILYGNHLTPKYVSHQEYIIRQRLRFLGRYLIMVKQINSDILELEHLFRPCHFETALKAVCQLAEVNNTTSAFIKPKVALDMIHCLKICSKILETSYFKEGNDKQRKNVNSFFKLLQSQSVGRINQSAHRELIASSRQNSIKKLRNLPLSDDITKFKSFLLNRAKTIYQNLLDNPFSYVVWRQLAELTLLYIVVYNGKRSGESQGILVEDFLDIHLLMPVELESFEGIDKEKITYKIVIRGKLNRTSCALIPQNLKLFLDYIYEHRAEAKVPDDNPYLFGLPGKLSGLRHKTLQTCFLMRKYTPMAKLRRPQNVRTTLLRNYLAKDFMINKVLDQDINLDTTSSTAERININKNGKKKKEIKNNKKCSRTITTTESNVDSKNATADNSNLHTIQTRSVRLKRTRINYSQQQRKILYKSKNDSYAASDSDVPSVNSFILEGEEHINGDNRNYQRTNIQKLQTQNKEKPIITKEKWNTAQKKIVYKFFGDYVKQGIYPSGLKIQAIINRYKELANRTVATTKSFLQNEMKKKSCSSR